MENSLSRQEIIELLADFVRGEITEEENKYIVSVTRHDSSIELHVDFERIDSLESKLTSLEINDETVLYNDNGYEIIVREEAVGPMRRMREDKIEVKNEENGLTYELSSASNEYLVWLLNEIKQNLSPPRFPVGILLQSEN